MRPTESTALRTNQRDLVAVTVGGQIVHPLIRGSVYRIGRDGVPRVVPGSGGVVLNRRIGDRVMGLVGDHVEPGVSVRNNDRDHLGGPGASNRALLALTCVGNEATVTTGPAAGHRGLVVGKHGGINHVIVDFPPDVLRRLRIGDRIQITAFGQGMALTGFPHVSVLNLCPRLLARWGIHRHGPHLHVPVTHLVPGALMGSGLGRSDGVLGDCDVQLSDPDVIRTFGLSDLRFGDLVAIAPLDYRFGPSRRPDMVSIGVVVHSDSQVAGHGPGVTPLLVGPAHVLRPWRQSGANLARVFGVRTELAPSREIPEARRRQLWSAAARGQLDPALRRVSSPGHRG